MLYVLLVYGLPFFILWTVILVYPRRVSEFSLARNLWMIALFAMFHGIHEWTEMSLLVSGPGVTPLRFVRLITLPLSFYFLLVFGIACSGAQGKSFLRYLIPSILSVAWIAVTVASSNPFITGDIFARYFLGVPGTFLTAFALLRQRREISLLRHPGACRSLNFAAATFLLYGALAGFVGPEADFFPAAVLNYTSFRDTTGIPVELLRAFVVILMTLSLIRILRLFEWEAVDSIKRANEAKVSQLAALVEASDDGIISLSTDGILRTWNKGAESIFGYTAEEVVGRSVSILVPPNRGGEVREILEKIGRGEGVGNFETTRIRKGGQRIDVSLTVSPIRDTDGRITGASAVSRDITERKKMEEIIRFQASHDALTGLPNRSLFMDLFRMETRQARRNCKKTALLFLDLDRFKEINDTLGHEFGDELLRAVAKRLKGSTRETDTIARIGGDEFNILLTDLVRSEDSIRIVKKIMSGFDEPYIIKGHDLRMTASVGISIYPDDNEELETLLRYADIAMYYAKENAGNNFQFYNDAINLRSIERIRLENWLGHALGRGELKLYYQPQLEILTNRLISAEALLRWEHPELGLLEPLQFLALAEETGLIIPIGEWVLRTACAQNRMWQKAGYKPISITVNISDKQFRNADLSEVAERILAETELEPKWLELEITENTIMRNAEITISRLSRLSRQGITLALDDFGTGYSSLNYLKRLPIKKIKVDKSFIKDITSDRNDRAIVDAVIAMTRNLDLQVVAEGVENEEQLLALRESLCDAVQGYLFSKPLPAPEFEEFYANYSRNSPGT